MTHEEILKKVYEEQRNGLETTTRFYVTSGLKSIYNKIVLEAMNEFAEQEAVDFAEWILKEGLEKYLDNGKCWWGKMSDDKDYNTEELFQLYKNKK